MYRHDVDDGAILANLPYCPSLPSPPQTDEGQPRLAMGGHGAEIWDVSALANLQKLKVGFMAVVECLASYPSPSGVRLVAVKNNGFVRAWNGNTGEVVAEFDARKYKPEDRVSDRDPEAEGCQLCMGGNLLGVAIPHVEVWETDKEASDQVTVVMSVSSIRRSDLCCTRGPASVAPTDDMRPVGYGSGQVDGASLAVISDMVHAPGQRVVLGAWDGSLCLFADGDRKPVACVNVGPIAWMVHTE
jgi:hypothetical protein